MMRGQGGGRARARSVSPWRSVMTYNIDLKEVKNAQFFTLPHKHAGPQRARCLANEQTQDQT